MEPVRCENCGKIFVPRESRVRNCSPKCGIEYQTRRKQEAKSKLLAKLGEDNARRDAQIRKELRAFLKSARKKKIKKEAKKRRYAHDLKVGKRILVIPDTQVKPGVDQSHLKWIGQYIAEKKPDIIVHIGDHWDMPSLSSYDAGRRSFEGRRYVDDIRAGNEAMDLLTSQYRGKYAPEEHFFIGNHEERIERATDADAKLFGLIGYKDLKLDGWVVHPFEDVVEIEGIKFAHYFSSGTKGLPVGSAAVMLKMAQSSAVQGHVQKVDLAVHEKTGNIAMMVGVCYMHDEGYLGLQGNNCRRQIVMLNEVKNGRFDPMMISLDYLARRYGSRS